jgi:hypothetical protein
MLNLSRSNPNCLCGYANGLRVFALPVSAPSCEEVSTLHAFTFNLACHSRAHGTGLFQQPVLHVTTTPWWRCWNNISCSSKSNTSASTLFYSATDCSVYAREREKSPLYSLQMKVTAQSEQHSRHQMSQLVPTSHTLWNATGPTDYLTACARHYLSMFE